MARERRAAAVTATRGIGAAVLALAACSGQRVAPSAPASPAASSPAHRGSTPAAIAGSARLPNRVQGGTGGVQAVCVQLPNKTFECSWANQVNPHHLLNPSAAG